MSLQSTPVDVAALDQIASNSTLRFQLELEFVSLLANPQYVHHLAQQGYLDDKQFIAYIQYLFDVWSSPDYLAHLTHVHCLAMMELMLESPVFRESIKSREYADLIHTQQFWHWRSFRYNRTVQAKQAGNNQG